MKTDERKRRCVEFRGFKVWVVIYFEHDLGPSTPKDKYGRTYVCKYDNDSPGNQHMADWLMGSGYGATEAESVAAFIADCNWRDKEGL
jgi:hypothetical protein